MVYLLRAGFMSILWLSVVSVTHDELGRGCGAYEMLLYAVNSEDYFTAATTNITQRQISCQFLATIGIFVVMVWIACTCSFLLVRSGHLRHCSDPMDLLLVVLHRQWVLLLYSRLRSTQQVGRERRLECC